MEIKKEKPIIYEMSGKARHGKDTTAEIIKKYYEKNGKKVINLAFGSYIKQYAKVISSWDGSEETKPRELLQQLGTNIIRNNIDVKFFIKRIIDDILVYSFFYDVITISDVRFVFEIDDIKERFDKVYSLNIVRPNFDNGLTEEQKKHQSETDLDNYSKHDYIILNDGNKEDLEKKVIKVIKEVESK